jgi:hypothetical protein
MRLRLLGAAIFWAAAFWVGGAAAQNYTAVIQTPMSLGNVAAGKTGDSLFRIDPATGSVLRLSGSAARTSNASAKGLVVITCNDAGNVGSCDASNVNIQIGATGTPIGRAKTLSNFRISVQTATIAAAVTGASPISFSINPVGTGTGKTFFVGADFPIAGDNSGQASGVSQSNFFVFVAKAPAVPTTGTVGSASAVVFRALTIIKNTDLAFGSISKPGASSGTVMFDPNTGLRTNTGNVGLLASPAPTLANFTLTGEGGQAYSVAVTPTFTLAGPTPLTVTTLSTVSGAQTFGSSLGAQASVTIKVGGSFPLSSATTEGSYTGTFTVTADYN